ncbi:MAG: hypothetical protein KatS3mg053_1706 [Candidatus Roseilinea sp.]|jgi:hypothetical protein|nr:MAG: hypothetical protein KatS3mg053_1706 [Candidatus Roseilinea sp.]
MATLIARFAGQKEPSDVLPFFRYFERVSDEGNPAEANALLGAPLTTLEQWCNLQVKKD